METERKFLVRDNSFKSAAFKTSRIVQGYLCSHAERTVRIRIKDDEGYITVKSASDEQGWSRYEFERQIPLEDAEEMMKLCLPGRIDKVRHYINVGGHIWEVDVFHGSNEGLVIAEIELDSVDEEFELPAWIGREVSGDVRYYNAVIAKNTSS